MMVPSHSTSFTAGGRRRRRKAQSLQGQELGHQPSGARTGAVGAPCAPSPQPGRAHSPLLGASGPLVLSAPSPGGLRAAVRGAKAVLGAAVVLGTVVSARALGRDGVLSAGGGVGSLSSCRSGTAAPLAVLSVGTWGGSVCRQRQPLAPSPQNSPALTAAAGRPLRLLRLPGLVVGDAPDHGLLLHGRLGLGGGLRPPSLCVFLLGLLGLERLLLGCSCSRPVRQRLAGTGEPHGLLPAAARRVLGEPRSDPSGPRSCSTAGQPGGGSGTCALLSGTAAASFCSSW